MSSPLRKIGINGARQASKHMGMSLDEFLHEAKSASVMHVVSSAIDVWCISGTSEGLDSFVMRNVQLMIETTGRTDGDALRDCAKQMIKIYQIYGDRNDS